MQAPFKAVFVASVLLWACAPAAVPVIDAGVVGALDAGTLTVDASVAHLADAGTAEVLDASVVFDAGEPTRPGLDAGTPWPSWIFSHWVWESESTAASALALLDDYAAHDIPVGALIVDSPWETQYNSLEWDRGLFPDPQGFVDAVHARNAKLLLWIVPIVNTDAQPLYDELKSKSYYMQRLPIGGPAVVSWWKGKGSLLDYLNPNMVAWWHTKLDPILAMGIDGWKCDGVDFSVNLAPYSPGKGNFANHEQYATAYYRDFYEYTRSKLGSERAITGRPVDMYGTDLGNAGIGTASFAPRDVNWAGWVGDQDSTFDGIKAALLNMYYSAQVGYFGFGSDIGGYRADDSAPPALGRTKELFIRWAQLGAFSTLMENGGTGEHRPWMFDVETTDIYRTFVKLHLALGPYFNREGLEAWSHNKSLVTYLRKSDYSYLLGRDIFVAPMLESGTTRSVTFPSDGVWVSLFDKTKVYAAGSTHTLNVPLAEYPVFLRQGSAIASELSP